MQVKNLLAEKNRDPITALPTQTLKESMRVLLENRISCLPVVNEQEELIGIISDKDIFAAIFKDVAVLETGKVADHMTRNLIVGLPEDEMDYIAGLMTKNKIRHIPIVEREKIVGLVSVGDVVKLQLDDKEVENRYLKSYIAGEYPG